MGAMASFAVACLVYVLASGKGQRLSLFLLMLGGVLYRPGLLFRRLSLPGDLRPGGILPLLAAVLCGLAIWALDLFLGRRILAALEGRSKAVTIAGASLVAAAVVYVLLAFQLTGSVTLEPQGPLSPGGLSRRGQLHRLL